MAVPLDLSIYVVDIAGKPFIILILSVQDTGKAINRKERNAAPMYYTSMPRSVRLVVMVRSSCPNR